MPAIPHLPLPRGARVAGEALTWCGAIAYPVILHVTMRGSRQGFSAPMLLLVAVLTVLTASLLRHRPLSALALLLAGGFATASARGMLEVGFLQVLISDLAVGYIAATRPRRTSLTAAIVALGAQAASALYLPSGQGAYVQTLAFIVVALAAAWTAGDSIRERREHAKALYSQATAQAVTAERLRIARELHDMIAHSVGVIAIQAGVGRRVIDTQPDEARNALAAIEATSKETLAGLGRTLGALRRADAGARANPAPRDPAPGLDDLDRLAASAKGAGIRVDIRWLGERRPLPADIELAAYRIVQESLTNVARHAGTRDCHVTVDYRAGELSIEVENGGRSGLVPGTGGATGWGIVGMRERIALLRGQFTAGPRPGGGFRVAARLPLPEGVHLP
ncbi:sensor histidine kinase [Streptomyces sp. NBC_01142]|uniref:sensor histidine kinase n=1 Tax=Streptomyces sp. NBC_01142 TaxID=2975865 RepID=UPI0022589FF2|nr:sensor histidine kinase [Streptomyces sp. NBC_01142]MCX4821164.1 sensor histidine kinase [Streptomyces sp. NBC_01142]